MTTMQQTDPGSGVAARVREARRSAGLTQGALAQLVGVTAHTVGSWEAGRRSPSPEHHAAVTFHCKAASTGAATQERSAPVTMSREERMHAVVGAIARHAAEHGYPPSLREVQVATGFSSLSVVNYALDWCEEAGLLVRVRAIARAVTLTEAGGAFAEAPEESGEQPVVRREDPASGGGQFCRSG